MYCSLNFKCSGALNTVDGSEDSLIREEILWDHDDSDDENTSLTKMMVM